MVLNSIKIKLERYQSENKLYYVINLKGDGTVTYTDPKRADIKTKIKEEEFLQILKIFKEIDFFSKEEDFDKVKDTEKEYITISIDIPISKDKTKTTSITHYTDDKNVPQDLVKLEKKIEETVDINNIIKSEKTHAKDIKEQKKNKFDKKKTLSILFVSAVLITSLFFVIDYLGSVDSEKDETLEISYFVTTKESERTNGIRSEEENYFIQGDTVYLDIEYTKIPDKIDICVNIVVSNNSYTYYSNNSNIDANLEKKDVFYSTFGFKTNNSWPAEKKYSVSVNITDNISKYSCNKKTSFILKNPNFSESGSLKAEIINLSLVDKLQLYFEGDASGGTGKYNYTWNFYEYNISNNNFLGSSIGKKGYYNFEEYSIIEVELIVTDGIGSASKNQIKLVK